MLLGHHLGQGWPGGLDPELIKYYRRAYLSPKGPKHETYLAWKKEWERVIYLP